jgi:hypothetical protein
MVSADGATLRGPVSRLCGGGGRYSTCCTDADIQNPGTHCTPSDTGAQYPGTQRQPGGGTRQRPLTQMKLLWSSSQPQ